MDALLEEARLRDVYGLDEWEVYKSFVEYLETLTEKEDHNV